MPTIAALLGALLATAAPSHACQLHRTPALVGEIGYRDCGRGIPVLIIPGGPGLDAEYMAPVAKMVVGMGQRAILVEPRGTGASRAALGDGSQLTIEGSVADIEAVRRATGAKKIILIGHSFGGGVAQAYAAAHPQHVAGLVLLDSVGPSNRPPRARLDSWRLRAKPGELARYDDARAKGDRISAMRLKFRIGFYDRSRGDAFVAAIPDTAIRLDVAPLAKSYDQKFHINSAQRAAFPVTLMAGDIDWIRGDEPALKAVYPGSRTIIIRHAGHFPWVDAPASFHRALRRVLTGR